MRDCAGSLRDYPLLQIKTALAATVMQLTRVATVKAYGHALAPYGIIDCYHRGRRGHAGGTPTTRRIRFQP
jgi:hypothetical protein